jgi:hypothetical protein
MKVPVETKGTVGSQSPAQNNFKAATLHASSKAKVFQLAFYS